MLKLNPVLDFVFPLSCTLCLKGAAAICNDCLKGLPRARLGCLRCGRKNPYGLYCSGCRVRSVPDRVLACYKFEGATRELIHNFKYEDVTSLAPPLARCVARLAREVEDHKDFVLVPVPLSRKRKAYRGYNQAELLCREMSKVLGMRHENILRRTNAVSSQVQAGSRDERRKNIKNSFVLDDAVELPKKIFLVDDVITSGATIEEATKILKKGGAEEVVCLAIALA